MKPLDLRAVEARHKETMNGFSSNPGPYVESAADVPALLAALRAHREALVSQAKVTAYYNGHGLEAKHPSPNDPSKEIWWDYLSTEAHAALTSVVDAREGARRE